MTIRDYMDNAVKNYPDAPAQKFYENGEWRVRSYAEFQSRVVRASSLVRDLRITPVVHNVALMLENCPEWEEIYLGLVSVGYTVVPMDPKFKEREVHHILKDSAAAGIVVGAKQQDVIAKAIKMGLPELKVCVVVGKGTLADFGEGCKGYLYEDAMAKAVDDEKSRKWYNDNKPGDESLASLIYTSGTTGVPKGAMLTHANFTSNADSAVQAEGFYSDDSFLVALPLFHAFSFSFSFILALACGGCGLFIRSLRTISEDIRILQPTTILAVPLMAEKMYTKIEDKLSASKAVKVMRALGLSFIVNRGVRKAFGGKLRRMAIGGAPTSVKVLEGFAKFGMPAKEGYGLTECSPLVSWPGKNVDYKIGTVGPILPCMQYKLVDKDSTGAGELCVKGPNVTQGYFKNPEATKEAFDDEGFFRTGDVARIDEKGNLSICGRRKALIVNREGKNIYPEEIEQIVNRMEDIAESLSLGYHVEGEVGEYVGLIVQPNEETFPSLGSTQQEREAALRDKLAALCKERLAEYKIPRKVIFRYEPFELTSTMKVRRGVYKGSLDELGAKK